MAARRHLLEWNYGWGILMEKETVHENEITSKTIFTTKLSTNQHCPPLDILQLILCRFGTMVMLCEHSCEINTLYQSRSTRGCLLWRVTVGEGVGVGVIGMRSSQSTFCPSFEFRCVSLRCRKITPDLTLQVLSWAFSVVRISRLWKGRPCCKIWLQCIMFGMKWTAVCGSASPLGVARHPTGLLDKLGGVYATAVCFLR